MRLKIMRRENDSPLKCEEKKKIFISFKLLNIKG